jgi:hypothetical protein
MVTVLKNSKWRKRKRLWPWGLRVFWRNPGGTVVNHENMTFPADSGGKLMLIVSAWLALRKMRKGYTFVSILHNDRRSDEITVVCHLQSVASHSFMDELTACECKHICWRKERVTSQIMTLAKRGMLTFQLYVHNIASCEIIDIMTNRFSAFSN